MSKRIDFAKQRRDLGRSLSNAVCEIKTMVQPVAHQHGIDLQAILKEASARKEEEKRLLTERLQESVVPLFINRAGHPDRIGCCVLVRLDSEFYAFTTAHVIRDAGSATLFAPSEGKGGKLRPLPPCTAHLNSSAGDNDLDVGVLVLAAGSLGAFERHAFLGETEIDFGDQPDDQSLESFYFVLGYSASRTQVKASRTKRHIHQQSFRCSTNPVDAAEYRQERMSQADHILLDFDHKEMRVEGRRATPPKLQGVSGGGIFQISRKPVRGPLVAIATQNRRGARLIVGTRIKHFLAMIRQLKMMSRSGGF
ncbi:MAG: hypothetical protein WA581_15430 [Candidatus Acidiferrales bacterium]